MESPHLSFYPPGVNSAFYVLSLQKEVTAPTEVQSTEDDLIRALEILATTWPFSGGSFLTLESRHIITNPRYESNAKEIEAELLARAGLHVVEQRVSVNYEVLSTYRQPPLQIASQLARSAFDDPTLGKLLEYHQQAWEEYYQRRRTDRSAWFIHLYKVRDLLGKIYRGKNATRQTLGISDDDWSFFGGVLNNNDLRHAEVSGTAPHVLRQDVDRLYKLAQEWTVAHLRIQGLPVVT